MWIRRPAHWISAPAARRGAREEGRKRVASMGVWRERCILLAAAVLSRTALSARTASWVTRCRHQHRHPHPPPHHVSVRGGGVGEENKTAKGLAGVGVAGSSPPDDEHLGSRAEGAGAVAAADASAARVSVLRRLRCLRAAAGERSCSTSLSPSAHTHTRRSPLKLVFAQKLVEMKPARFYPNL